SEKFLLAISFSAQRGVPRPSSSFSRRLRQRAKEKKKGFAGTSHAPFKSCSCSCPAQQRRCAAHPSGLSGNAAAQLADAQPLPRSGVVGLQGGPLQSRFGDF